MQFKTHLRVVVFGCLWCFVALVFVVSCLFGCGTYLSALQVVLDWVFVPMTRCGGMVTVERRDDDEDDQAAE